MAQTTGLEQDIMRTIANALGIPVEEVTGDTLIYDPKVQGIEESLRLVDATLAVEKIYNVPFNDEETDSVTTVQSLIDLTLSKISGKLTEVIEAAGEPLTSENIAQTIKSLQEKAEQEGRRGWYWTTRQETVRMGVRYRVWANSPEDALRKLRDGDGEQVSTSQLEVHETTEFTDPHYDIG